jgi:ABC-type lipoprotein release transport system permease subunit
VIGKIAFRNLFRNTWRSVLTAGGVAAAVFVLVWFHAFLEGWMSQMIRGATSLETGQVQLQTKAYADEPKIWFSFSADETLYERVADLEGVESVEPRVEFSGLVGNDRRSKVSRYVGLDARRSDRLAASIVEGRWLADEPPERPAPREVVLGVDLARQLEVEVGDELVALASAQDGSLGNELLEVVGIVEAGHNAVDQRTTFMHLEDAQFLAAMEGEVHELKIQTSRVRDARATAERLQPVARSWQSDHMADATTVVDGDERPTELVVRTWQDLLPTMANYLELSRNSMWFVYLVLYFLAALGVLNTQRMSTLDREREFGVLQAIGMSPGRVFATVLWETTLLTLIGAIVGAALATGVNLYLATYGFHLGVFLEQSSFTFMGVSVSTTLYPVVTFWGTLLPVLAILPVACLCGLWPALTSARLEPARAISKKD